MAKKVLIVAGDAVEAQELFYPYWRLKEEGFEVHVAAPKKKVLFTVVHDFEPGIETYTEKPGYRFPWVDLEYKDVKPDEYDGLFIPGGRAPEYMRTDEELRRIVEHFIKNNKPIAAICHGPLVLTGYDLVKGKTLTAYPVLKYEIINAGAKFEDKELVVDGNILTSRAWPDLPALLKAFIEKIKS